MVVLSRHAYTGLAGAIQVSSVPMLRFESIASAFARTSALASIFDSARNFANRLAWSVIPHIRCMASRRRRANGMKRRNAMVSSTASSSAVSLAASPSQFATESRMPRRTAA